MSTQPKRLLTPEEFLAIEREAEFAMGGAPEPHNDICVNIIAEMPQQLRSHPCKVYSNEMRIRTPLISICIPMW
jgi:hypothetical protein